MTLSDFKAKLNWRLILVHMAACWFIYYAFNLFSFLNDVSFTEALLRHANMQQFSPQRITHNLIWESLEPQIAILIAFIISLVVTRLRHWYWVNSLAAFMLACLLCRFGFAWHYLKIILLTPGDLFHTVLWKLIINGSVMLAIGLLLLFLNGVARFIDGRIVVLAS